MVVNWNGGAHLDECLASLRAPRLGDGRVLEDAVWSYETERLLPDGPPQIADLVSFIHDEVEVRIGDPVASEAVGAD